LFVKTTTHGRLRAMENVGMRKTKSSVALRGVAILFVAGLSTWSASPAGAQQPQTFSAEGKFPMAGRSLGGIMRSAPSMSSARLAGLAEGTPIMLLGRAGTMDNYDWFTIQHNGTTGYQWGGIMCSEQAIRGIFQQCKP